MTANTTPIYPLTPKVWWSTALTAANTAMDGTGTTATVYTAGTDGGFVSEIRAKSLGTCVQSVVRVFLNNGSSSATAANNVLIAELTVQWTTASNFSSNPEFIIPINKMIPAGYKILVCIGTAVAAGLNVTCFASDY